jgi:Ni,Fe-hydrogenase III small subunit
MTPWLKLVHTLRAGPRASAPPPVDTAAAESLAERLHAADVPGLGRSLAILHVDSGSCGGCEIELRAVRRAVGDLERFGVRFVASPRHADILLVTGPVARNMTEALQQAYAAMPQPKFIVAVGDCAVDGGVFKGSYAVVGGLPDALQADLLIGGCPPTPEGILSGLRALLAANARSRRRVSWR